MKCLVKDCKNHEHQGTFNNTICMPCSRLIEAMRNRTQLPVFYTSKVLHDVIRNHNMYYLKNKE